jgi:hypothetical protein
VPLEEIEKYAVEEEIGEVETAAPVPPEPLPGQ